MPDVKVIHAVSDWQTYILDTPSLGYDLEVKVKVKAIDPLTMGDNTEGGKVSRPSKFLVGCVLDAVVDWDLTEDEKPVPVTDEAKKKFFSPLLGILIKDKQTCLATEIFEFARDGGNFLKN